MTKIQLEERCKKSEEVCLRIASEVIHEHGILINDFHISYLMRGFSIGHKSGCTNTYLDLDALIRSSSAELLSDVKGIFLHYRSKDSAFSKKFDPKCGWTKIRAT